MAGSSFTPWRSNLMRTVCLAACLMFVTPMTAGAAEAVRVPVRGGIHDRFNRMVLDWPMPVKYTMTQNAGAVTIQFDTPGTLAMSQFRAAQPPYITNVSAANNDQGLELHFDVPDQARVQAFWSGKSVAFDVLLMTKPKPADQTAPPSGEAVKAPETVAPPPIKDQTTGPQKPETLAPEVSTQGDLAKAVAAMAQPPQSSSVPSAASDKTPSSNGLRTLADEQADATVQQEPHDTKTFKASETTAISIRPIAKVGLAAFLRAGRLWIVLDQASDGVTPQVDGAFAKELKTYSRQKTDKGTAFIFELPATIAYDDVVVRQDKLNWDIIIRPTKREPTMLPASATAFELQLNGQNSVSLVTGQDTRAMSFLDDHVGDKIWVVPVRSPLLNIPQTQKSPAMIMIPTFVGGALVPQQDNLTVTARDNQILIQSPQDALPLSSAQDRELSVIKQSNQANLFQLKVPLFPPSIKSFEAQRQYLEKNLMRQTDKADKALACLDLARLYLRQGFGSEAQGALQLALGYVSNLTKTPAYNALQAMAYALSGHVDQAMALLKRPELQTGDLARLWLAYTEAQNKDWEKAYLDFRTTQAVIKSYPPEVAAKLNMAAAESAVETKNYKDAQTFLINVADDRVLNRNQRAARDFMQAMLWRQGDDLQQEKAERLLRILADGNDRYYRIKAEMALLPILLASNEIKTKDAIDTLERLRFAWRGDRQEVMILQELGRYYLADNNPMQAMTIWRQAVALAENDNDKTHLQNDLQQQFNAMFVAGDLKGMPPLQAVALYQRFKDLMPTGADGARATMQLVDQLLQFDLIDDADNLLDDQLKQQTDDVQIAMLGTRLATIRLIARDADGALAALDASQKDGTPADLQAKRLLLRARALADERKMNDALALLDNPSVPEGLSLRADIFWRMERWSDAAYDFQTLADSVTDKTPKNKAYTHLILRLAIAKAMQNDQLGLDQLNAQYGELMNASDQAKPFQVMTASLEGGGTLSDLETLKSQVANSELFESFLKNF